MIKEKIDPQSMDIFENCLFTNLAELEIRRTPISSLDVPLLVIEIQWNLNINRANDFKVAKEILIKSVKNN
jgi:hypothetical protein